MGWEAGQQRQALRGRPWAGCAGTDGKERKSADSESLPGYRRRNWGMAPGGESVWPGKRETGEALFRAREREG